MAFKVASGREEVCFCLLSRFSSEEASHTLRVLGERGFRNRMGEPPSDEDLEEDELAFGWNYSKGEHMGVLSIGGYEQGEHNVLGYEDIMDLLAYNDS